MERVTCDFCGLAFSVRSAPEDAKHYCCSGCALASRIPVVEGRLPVSKALITALALGFGTFNQVLFALLGTAVLAEGRMEVGSRFLIVSMAIGLAVVLTCLAFLFTTRPWRAADLVGGVLGVIAACVAIYSVLRSDAVSASWILVATNLWFVCWMSRGWLRRALRRKRTAAEST